MQDLRELIQYARANPDKLTNASSGKGTVSHLAMEEIKGKAGMAIRHIPYKGSVAGLTGVIGGNVALALETAAAVRPHVESGRLRALAAGSARGLTGSLAALPTLGGMKRNAEVEQKLIALGLQPRSSNSPEEAAIYLRKEFENWGEIVKRNGVQLE